MGEPTSDAVLRERLAEAKRDADLGWADAEKRQKEVEEWAATCKRLMADNELLRAALAHGKAAPEGQARVCGAVASTVSGHLGPCTGGWHHESFPHQDGAGARWQVLVLPVDAAPDDLTARLAAAYYARFDNDGHPEDSTTAAEVAMSVLGPELDRLRGELEELRQIVAAPVSAAAGPEFGRALVGKVRELVDERRHHAIAAEAVGRVRAECDRIEAAVRANPQDPDFDGAYLACLRHVRAALDGTGEA